MSRAPKVMRAFQAAGLLVEKASHVHESARRQDVDDPVVLDVRDRRGVVGVARSSRTKFVSSSPMAVVWLRRWRSAASRALP